MGKLKAERSDRIRKNAIPINIEELLHQQVIESARIEYKPD